MNTKTYIIPFLLGLCMFSGCFSSVDFTKPNGETAELWTKDSHLEIELISLSDTAVYFLYDKHIYESKMKDFKQIHINGYSIFGPKLSILLLPLGAELTALFTTIKEQRSDWIKSGLFCSLLLASTIFAICHDNPEVSFTNPLTKDEIYLLKHYSRYPNELNSKQWKDILTFYKQDKYFNILDVKQSK
jgi:hypothetical protein